MEQSSRYESANFFQLVLSIELLISDTSRKNFRYREFLKIALQTFLKMLLSFLHDFPIRIRTNFEKNVVQFNCMNNFKKENDRQIESSIN